MKTVRFLLLVQFFLLDQKSACFDVWKQILWYLIDLLFVDLFVVPFFVVPFCHVMQSSIELFPKQQVDRGEQRNRKGEKPLGV